MFMQHALIDHVSSIFLVADAITSCLEFIFLIYSIFVGMLRIILGNSNYFLLQILVVK